MSRFYRVQEFAELAGVTVKALHHYDRLGLLKPQRTEAGYRVYSLADLERLEQIVALKFLGLPLKQVKTLLDRDALQLPNALRLQRRELEHKRRLLDLAIRAIEDAENRMQTGEPANSLALKKIIEVISMQSNTDFMRKYYSEEAWAKWKERHEQWPSEAWIALLGDIQASLGKSPDSEEAQALAARWLNLRDSESGGDPTVLAGLMKSWVDRQHWPPNAYQKISKFNLEGIARFISEASLMHRRKYYSDEAWSKWMAQSTPEERERRSLAWFDLCLEIGASLDEDPASEKAQDLTRRWMVLARETSGDDLGLREGALRAWADRQNWPAVFRHEMELFQREQISLFIRKANASANKKYFGQDVWKRKMELLAAPGQDSMGLLWNAMYQDVRAALNEDPGSDKAQALAQRWLDLVDRTAGGDPRIRMGMIKTSLDKKNWPAWGQTHIESLKEISEFIGKAQEWPLKKYYTAEGWLKRGEQGKQATPEHLSQLLQLREELFGELEAVLGVDPASSDLKELKARWLRNRKREAGGDPDILAGKNQTWEDRRNWPTALRLREAASYGMTIDRFEEVADLLDKIS